MIKVKGLGCRVWGGGVRFTLGAFIFTDVGLECSSFLFLFNCTHITHYSRFHFLSFPLSPDNPKPQN